MAWQGWGAGPAGAGQTSKVFLGIAMGVAIVMTAMLAREQKGWEAGVTAAAAVYFGLRLFGKFGGRA